MILFSNVSSEISPFIRKSQNSEKTSNSTDLKSETDLTLHQGAVQPPLPTRQGTTGLRPALIGRAERLPQLPLLGAVAAQEVVAAQVDGDHQTLVAVEGFLHHLDERRHLKNDFLSQTLFPGMHN